MPKLDMEPGKLHARVECGRNIDSPSVARGLRYISTQES